MLSVYPQFDSPQNDRGLTNGGGAMPQSYRSDHYIDDNSSRRGASRRGDFRYFWLAAAASFSSLPHPDHTHLLSDWLVLSICPAHFHRCVLWLARTFYWYFAYFTQPTSLKSEKISAKTQERLNDYNYVQWCICLILLLPSHLFHHITIVLWFHSFGFLNFEKFSPVCIFIFYFWKYLKWPIVFSHQAISSKIYRPKQSSI